MARAGKTVRSVNRRGAKRKGGAVAYAREPGVAAGQSDRKGLSIELR